MAGAIIMVGAIIVVGAIVTGAIIMVITVGDHCLVVVIILEEAASVWRLFHLREAAFAAWPHAKAAKVSLDGSAVALRLRGGVLRRAVLEERSRAYLPEEARPSMRRPVRCQCVGSTIPDSMACVTSDDADQASVAVLSMCCGTNRGDPCEPPSFVVWSLAWPTFIDPLPRAEERAILLSLPRLHGSRSSR
jgi:hypothetical protein